jgi:hypothetical protein
MERYRRLRLKMVSTGVPLRPGESPFSANLVTGKSINFPIAATCSPSTVCGETCYAGCGPITWSASLAKQYRNLASCTADPVQFGELVAADARAMGLDFITWNGSGDLFTESVQAINHIGLVHPDLTQWVRTRKPKMAGLIQEAPSVYVHFSLDRDSLTRAAEVQWQTTRRHYSYQYAKDEDASTFPDIAGIVFGHDYKLPPGVDLNRPEICPLNTLEDISGACGKCRKCFGDAAHA